MQTIGAGALESKRDLVEQVGEQRQLVVIDRRPAVVAREPGRGDRPGGGMERMELPLSGLQTRRRAAGGFPRFEGQRGGRDVAWSEAVALGHGGDDARLVEEPAAEEGQDEQNRYCCSDRRSARRKA